MIRYQEDRWIYGLFLIPLISAILALYYHHFIFKSGVAGGGIFIIVIRYFRNWRQSKDLWLILMAFLFSIGGDWFLSNRHGEEKMFIAGIALFFVAHVGYLSFALVNGRLNGWLTLLLLVSYLSFFALAIYPSIHNPVLMVSVLVYLLISCISLGAAGGITAHSVVKWSYFAGITLVVFSDTIIAFREFVGYKSLDFLILPTYYLAQICVTLSVVAKWNFISDSDS